MAPLPCGMQKERTKRVRKQEFQYAHVHRREQFKRVVQFFSSVIMLGLLTLVFANVWYNYYSDCMVLPFYRRGNWVMIGIYATVLFLFFKVYGAFKIGYLRRMDVLLSQVLATLGTNAVTYLQVSLVARNFVDVRPMVMLVAVELLILLCWTILSNKFYFFLYPPRRLVIVYGSPAAADLVMKMSYRVDKYMICESISAEEDMDTITERILQFDGVIICDIPAQQRNDLVKFCFEKKLRAYIAPKISDIILRGADDIRLFDTPLLLCRNYGLTFEQRLMKRAFDLVFCLLVLIPALPIMLICGIAVKLCDGGPIFYKQRRLTKDGKEFDVYKFRSMIIDAEADGVQVSCDHDVRVTKVGRFLRKCRLDELPQILNILKGDMSVVGPRPERPELCAEYEKQFPEFRFRLHVKAGLTGYAQVTGVYDTTPYDKLKMDLMYIENYSLFRDIQIVLMTLKTTIFPVQKSNAQLLRLKDTVREEEKGNEAK